MGGNLVEEEGTRSALLELWLLDDDATWGRVVGSMVQRFARGVRVRTLRSLREADAAITRGAPLGALLDERFPEGSGVGWAVRHRGNLVQTHVVLCTGYASPTICEYGYGVIDHLLMKPPSEAALRQFVARSLLGARSSSRPGLFTVAERLCAMHRLTTTETTIVKMGIRGFSRAEIAATFGTTPLTVKDQIRAICRKLERRNLRAIVGAIVDLATR